MKRLALTHPPQQMHLPAHPNEFDRRRILRALKARQRYRYVTPQVASIEHGYLITAPCCSRNVRSDGGVVDIACLTFEPAMKVWWLLCKDHQADAWRKHACYRDLREALTVLLQDEGRQFWQ